MTPINISLILFTIGLYGAISKNNLIKKVIGLTIINASVVLYFIAIGYREEGLAPIMSREVADSPNIILVNPLPQALMLTAIVVSISLTALALALVVKIYAKYKTLDIQKIYRE
ncbi:MAG: sodium:proton antiporter [Atribacterota bacterium]